MDVDTTSTMDPDDREDSIEDIFELDESDDEAEDDEIEQPGLPSWRTTLRLLREHFPQVKRAQHTKDACNYCVLYQKEVISYNKWKAQIKISSGPQFDDRLKKLKTAEAAFERHRCLARTEFQHYKSSKEQATKNWTDTRQHRNCQQSDRCVLDAWIHLAVDAMRTQKLPHFGARPQPNETYYLEKLSIYNLGIVDEGASVGLGYLWDETLGAVSANHVINTIWFWIFANYRGEKFLRWTFDNCSVNKNFMVSWPISPIFLIGFKLIITLCWILSGYRIRCLVGDGRLVSTGRSGLFGCWPHQVFTGSHVRLDEFCSPNGRLFFENRNATDF